MIASHAAEQTTGRPATFEWGVRPSLLRYMESDPQFQVTTRGDAHFSLEHGVRMGGFVDEAGTLRLEGAVILAAHGGALTVPLVDVIVAPSELTIEDPVDGSPARLRLLDLRSKASDDEGWESTASLASDADALFMYNYSPGSEFDPVTVRFSGG